MYGDKAQKPLLQRLLPTRLQNLLCALPTVIRPLGCVSWSRTAPQVPRLCEKRLTQLPRQPHGCHAHAERGTALTAGAVQVRAGRAATLRSHPRHSRCCGSFEASPSCRIVRERLSSLELPYMLHNVAPGSAKVAAMQSFAGRAHVPYLVDANTGFRSFSTGDILKYLDTTYMRAPSLAESAPQQGGKQARR